MKTRTTISVLILVAGVAALSGVALCSPARHQVQCSSGKTGIVADTSGHELLLCQGGKFVHRYSIRIGKNGTGKSKEGDGKTPLGNYRLGVPRQSPKFGTFVPIEYPSAVQRKQGFSGGSVGIHGPDRRVRWLGRLVNTFDTTDGCLGLASDGEISEIARWVREQSVEDIEIR